MKKTLLLTQILLISLGLFSQGQMMIDRKVPQAGTFLEEGQHSFSVEKQECGKEDGYDSLNMYFQGNWALGTPKDVVSSMSGDTIFVVAGGGVVISDITNPESPQLISEVYARSQIDFIYYDRSDKYLYLAAYFSGFEIWDLADITNPVRLSRTPMDVLPRGGIYAYSGYLYVITYSDGMYIYDISDPIHPQYVSTTSFGGNCGGYFADDNFIYIVTNNAIRLFDLSIPQIPNPRDNYPCSSPKGIFVADGYGYIADQSGLKIIDVSDPDDLILKGSLAIPGTCYDVTVIDEYAYVANNWYGGTEGGVYAINISDLENPVQSDFYANYYNAVSGVSDYICCTNNEGYALFDVSTAGQLELINQTGLPGFVTDVVVKDGYAYTGSNGIRIFDMTDHSQPQQVKVIESDALLINIKGELAACIPESMSTGNRLNLLDISDPENAYELGFYEDLRLTQEAIIHGDYIYVAGWWDGVTILNITDPSSPAFVKKVHNWTSGAIPGEEFCYASDISVQGNYLYIIDHKPFEDEDSKGLYIYDISDPENPAFVTRYKQQCGYGWRIQVEGDYAYLADREGGIEVIDISDPMMPETVSYLALMDVAYNLDVSNGYVYASCYILGGVQAIDISEPENPSVAGYYYRSGMFALNVAADGHDIYIADGGAGFQIYEHDVPFTGIGDQQPGDKMLGIFPNPTDGITNLNLDLASEALLFDQAGRFIKKIIMTPGSNKIDLSERPNGIYYLKFKTKGELVVKKIVLAK